MKMDELVMRENKNTLIKKIIITVLLIGVVIVYSSNITVWGNDENKDLYRYTIVVETTSDWTTIEFNDTPIIATYKYVVQEGQDAPELQYTATPQTIWISKQQFDSTLVKLRIDVLALKGPIESNVHVDKGAIGYTRISLIPWNESTPSWSLELPPGTPSTKNFTVNYSGLYSNPVGTAVYIDPEKQIGGLVLTFYYPWYATPWGPSGFWGHWENVTYNDIGNTPFYPLFGVYDSNDSRVIDAQMELMKEIGIDGVVVSWWGPGGFEDKVFPLILDSAFNHGLKATIYYESYRPWDDEGMTNATRIAGELAYVVNNYAGHPGFLKIDDKPVIFIYAVTGHHRTADFWSDVRRNLESIVGRVYLIGDVRGLDYTSVMDGFHNYIVFTPEEMNRIYRDYYERYQRTGTINLDFDTAISIIGSGGNITVERKINFYTVTPGYNDTEIRSPGNILPRNNGDTYRDFWENALNNKARWILVSTWNEYHEGTTIEPTREYGFLYTYITKYYTSILKNTSMPYPWQQNNTMIEFTNLTINNNAFKITITNPTNTSAIAVKVWIKGGEITLEDKYIQPSPSGETVEIIPIIGPREEYVIQGITNGDAYNQLANSKISIEYFSPTGLRGHSTLKIFRQPETETKTVTTTKTMTSYETKTKTHTSTITRTQTNTVTETTSKTLIKTLTETITSKIKTEQKSTYYLTLMIVVLLIAILILVYRKK